MIKNTILTMTSVCLLFLAFTGSADAATLTVGAGVDAASNGRALQAALDAAVPGDTVELEAGGTFLGGFNLAVKSCVTARSEEECWITIRTSAEGELPAPGARINPSHSATLPKLVSYSGPVLSTEPGAHH